MNIDDLRIDCAKKQKRGLHIIISSIFIWIAVTIIHLSQMPMLTKNLFTFFCTAPLLPISFIISKIIKVDFQNKNNPLTNLGILFSGNQILYLLIAMWVFPTIPEKMLMVLAVIFGAHLLPYSWLYKSTVYFIFSIAISLCAFIVGLKFEPIVLCLMMIIFEFLFSICLIFENNK